MIKASLIRTLQRLNHDSRPDITHRAFLKRNIRAKFEALNRCKFTDADCRAQSAISKPKALLESLPKQRDSRCALIKANSVDTAKRNSAFAKSAATSQILSKTKNNMVANSGRFFYKIRSIWQTMPVCLMAKQNSA